MDQTSSKEKVTAGLFWAYAERISAQMISLIVSIILARLLDPDHYGVISIVMIFITFCNAFVTGGFGNSLVQKKGADDLDFNTMLICSVVVSLALYAGLFVAAPYVAAFYNMPILSPVLRVLSLRLPLSGVNSIQQAKVQKEMKFRQFFYATLIGTLISAVVGIVMAYAGFGVWALVTQYLTNTTVDTIVLFITSRWHIRAEFSFARAKELLSFGWKVLVTTVVFTIESDLRSLIIGKVFGAADLAYYDQGKKYPNVIVTNINSSISKVMFPALANAQDDLARLKVMCRRAIKTGIYVLAPLLIGLMAVSDIFVELVLTEKWLPCVPFMQIVAIMYLLRPLTTTCQQAIMAIGRSDITLKIEILLNIVATILLCLAVFIYRSVIMIAWSTVVSELFSLGMFLYYINKFIGYQLKEQAQDFLPSLGLASAMGLLIYAMGRMPVNHLLLLGLQILAAIIFYAGLSVALRLDPLHYLLRMVYSKKHIPALTKVLSWMEKQTD